MNKDEQLGNIAGKMFFKTKDDLYARFLIQLQNEKLNKHDFFNVVIRGFVDDDERLVSFIQDNRESFLSKTRKRIMEKERKKGKEYKDKFALSKDDIEDIFDLLEEEQDL